MIYGELLQEFYFIYILRCSDNSYYTGLTDDLLRRLSEHHQGLYSGCYTYLRRPLFLEYFETIPILEDAIEREIQIKKWYRRKKVALINRDYHRLKLFAECLNLRHRKYEKELKERKNFEG